MDDYFLTLAVWTALVVGIIGLVIFDFLILPKSPYLSWSSCIQLYAIKNYHYLSSWVKYFGIVRSSKRFKQIEEKLLLTQLRKCSDTAYGRQNLTGIRTVDDYVSKVPMTSYDDYAPYIARIKQGELDVMTKDEIRHFASSSGTTGEPKALPNTHSMRNDFGKLVVAYDKIPTEKFGKTMRALVPVFRIYYPVVFKEHAHGKLQGPGTAFLPAYYSGWPQTTLPFHISLLNGLVDNEIQYVHLLFGLREKGIRRLEATYIPTLYVLFNLLEKRWRDLVRDLRNGTVDPSIQLSPDARVALQACLKPDPLRAEELEWNFEQGFDGIAKRIWPHLQVIMSITSGSFDVYRKFLAASYTKGVAVYSTGFGSSETFQGMNMEIDNPEVTYLLFPDHGFFEFLPFEQSEDPNAKPLRASQVEIGGTYELILTNKAGLFRYRSGDVVQVSKFFHQAPVVQFLFRKSQLLNIRGERTTETNVYRSLMFSVARCDVEGATIVDYACAESPVFYKMAGLTCTEEDAAPYYIIFVEMELKSPLAISTEDLACKMAGLVDDELQNSGPLYKQCRQRKGLKIPEIRILKPGAFLRERQHRLSTTATSGNQMKATRLVNSSNACKFFAKEAGFF